MVVKLKGNWIKVIWDRHLGALHKSLRLLIPNIICGNIFK